MRESQSALSPIPNTPSTTSFDCGNVEARKITVIPLGVAGRYVPVKDEMLLSETRNKSAPAGINSSYIW